MTFQSILFRNCADHALEKGEPDFFTDLNLDTIITGITAGKDEYNLSPYFYTPLHDEEAVFFRHEVLQDLEDKVLLGNARAFAQDLHQVREHLAQLEKRYYQLQKDRWFLDAVNLYVGAVDRLAEDLSAAKLQSRALVAFRSALLQYAASEHFKRLREQTRDLEAELSAIRYSILIQGLHVEVGDGHELADYSEEVEVIFERFKQGSAKSYIFDFLNSPEMNHIEGQILDLVAKFCEGTFAKLQAYCQDNKDFIDPGIVLFDREIQFYVSYIDYISPLKTAGLLFCYPKVDRALKAIYSNHCFDLALGSKLVATHAVPVTNGFFLEGAERIVVVSGPNQGGKTTFARTFGQLHYLASLGYPVPGADARLFLSDRIFSHFERQERMTDLRGKLEDDLVRIHAILETATSSSIVIINEIFASTTLRDALFLSKRVADALMDLDLLCVWVTFIDEIVSLSGKTVSMASTVVPDNPAMRTFKIVRKAADGLAYAMSIAEKHRLTYSTIRERVGS